MLSWPEKGEGKENSDAGLIGPVECCWRNSEGEGGQLWVRVHAAAAHAALACLSGAAAVGEVVAVQSLRSELSCFELRGRGASNTIVNALLRPVSSAAAAAAGAALEAGVAKDGSEVVLRSDESTGDEVAALRAAMDATPKGCRLTVRLQLQPAGVSGWRVTTQAGGGSELREPETRAEQRRLGGMLRTNPADCRPAVATTLLESAGVEGGGVASQGGAAASTVTIELENREPAVTLYARASSSFAWHARMSLSHVADPCWDRTGTDSTSSSAVALRRRLAGTCLRRPAVACPSGPG